MDKLPERKCIRLKGYDYSQGGYYFVTICSKDRRSIFWDVGATCGRHGDKIQLSNSLRVPFQNRLDIQYGKDHFMKV